jgi:hypothetical protein
MRLDKYQHAYVREILGSGDRLEMAEMLLEFLKELVEREQKKAKAQSQYLKLQDLWILCESAREAVSDAKARDGAA